MSPVLDEAQLRRIENVHTGFLYQHLYAVSILLSGTRIGWSEISVERDEDIEAELPEQRLYIQVKKRADNLTFGDISDVLERFAEIRKEHQSNHRASIPVCWIISNAEPGPDLARRVQNDWPADVHLRTPLTCSGDTSLLPVPGGSLPQMFETCVRLARQVPHSTLQPETLVWKLAALVQYLATGAMQNEHALKAEELHPLLEQLITQLQNLPEALDNYRPQENEPAYQSEKLVRLITGFSIRQDVMGWRGRHPYRRSVALFRCGRDAKRRYSFGACERDGRIRSSRRQPRAAKDFAARRLRYPKPSGHRPLCG